VQFGQVSPEMGQTENQKMPDFGNQPPRGLSGGLTHISFSMEGPIVWSFAMFLGGIVKPPFQYGMQVKVVCHQEKQKMEIFSNCKKILGISPNYHYFPISNF